MDQKTIEIRGREAYTEKYGFNDANEFVFRMEKGLSKKVVEDISKLKNEPEWMTKFRHRALDIFYRKPMPGFGGDLSKLNFDEIYYYIKPSDGKGRTWDAV